MISYFNFTETLSVQYVHDSFFKSVGTFVANYRHPALAEFSSTRVER